MIGNILLALLTLLLAFQAATQVVAHSLRYAPWLGLPYIWHLYAPWHWPFWCWRYAWYYPQPFRRALWTFLGIVIVASALRLGWRLLHRSHTSTTFGSSRWATRQELRQQGLLR